MNIEEHQKLLIEIKEISDRLIARGQGNRNTWRWGELILELPIIDVELLKQLKSQLLWDEITAVNEPQKK